MTEIPSGYLEDKKCDVSLFYTFSVINVNRDLIIRPIKLRQLELEGEVFFENSFSEDIQKYLPEIYPKSVGESHEILRKILINTRLHNCFLFAICLEKTNYPIGYIFCSSPLTTFQNSNEIAGDWVIDFWLNKKLCGLGIMTSALPHLLLYLKEFKISKIKAFVNKNNSKAIRVLEKLKFDGPFKLLDVNYFEFEIEL